MEAHNAYLQGHFYFQRRNLEDYRKAVSYFDEAIRLDPDYALAYAERSEAWSFIGDLTGQRADRVAESEERCGEGRRDRAFPGRGARGPWLGSFFYRLEVCRRPERTKARERTFARKSDRERFAGASYRLSGASSTRPNGRPGRRWNSTLFPSQRKVISARVLFVAGKLDEADAVARKTAELQPAAAGNHRCQVHVAVQRGDGETALREAQLEPDEGYRRFELALAHYVRGDRAAADAALADLIANGRDQLAYQIAEVYAVRGETDKAFEWLQISFDNHDTGTLTLVDRSVVARLARRSPLQELARKTRFTSSVMSERNLRSS